MVNDELVVIVTSDINVTIWHIDVRLRHHCARPAPGREITTHCLYITPQYMTNMSNILGVVNTATKYYLVIIKMFVIPPECNIPASNAVCIVFKFNGCDYQSEK